jgi:DMSO/TMAO reductase YedYZ molybdopterin-dependent catalytic subunit
MSAALATGALLGVASFLVSLAVNPDARGGPLAAGLWSLVAWLAWGLALGWLRDRVATASAGARPAPIRSQERDPERSGAEMVDRRRFLVRVGGATALITVVGAGVGALVRDDGGVAAAEGEGSRPWSARNELPNAGATPEPVAGTRPELTPVPDHYRIDINTTPPSVDAGEWRLQVDGLVDQPRSFTLDALRTYEPVHQFVTLSCISNRLGGDLISTTRWTGVPLQRLLPDLGLQSDATHLRISSVDGFFEVVDLEVARADERVMLAYAWDGLPLPERHGFPLRIYVPDVYGMKQPKWIDRIEAIDGWAAGYWVERGWDAEARMRATSVIDTVQTDMMVAGEEGRLVPVGGIAHAGARGIERVEVRVDDGPWREAELRPPLSGTTWVLWRYEWPFEPGQHTLTVRCVDGDGETQIAERNPVRPSGATGLVSTDVMLQDAPGDAG